MFYLPSSSSGPDYYKIHVRCAWCRQAFRGWNYEGYSQVCRECSSVAAATTKRQQARHLLYHQQQGRKSCPMPGFTLQQLLCPQMKAALKEIPFAHRHILQQEKRCHPPTRSFLDTLSRRLRAKSPPATSAADAPASTQP